MLATLWLPVVSLLLGAAAAPAPAGVESQLRALEQQWMNAIVKQDIATIEKILAPEFTLTVAVDGEPLDQTPRDRYLEACKGFYVIHSFKFHELLVRVYGDVSVVSARYSQKATLGGSEDRSAEFFLSDTWVKREGAWRVAARYSSRPEPTGPAR